MFKYSKPGLKFLPYTNNRYRWDDFYNTLTDKFKDCIIEVDSMDKFDLPNTIYDRLSWEEAWTLTHKPINLDLVDFLSNWKNGNIQLIKVPDTKENKSSRFWKFNRLESRTFPNYFYIPGFTNYVIDEKGEIISLFRGEKMSAHISTLGYPSVRLVRDDRKEIVIPIHRLLVSVFKDWDHNIVNLEVDHLDGNKCNYSLTNLELVNKEVNIRRAVENNFYVNEITKEYVLRDALTDELKSFTFITDLAKYIQVNDATVKYHLGKVDNDSLIKGRYYVARRIKNSKGEYLDECSIIDDDKWRILASGLKYREGSQPRSVLVKNIVTDEIRTFKSVVDFLKESNLTRKQVYDNLKRSTQKRYGDFIFKYEDDVKEWLI